MYISFSNFILYKKYLTKIWVIQVWIQINLLLNKNDNKTSILYLLRIGSKDNLTSKMDMSIILYSNSQLAQTYFLIIY